MKNSITIIQLCFCCYWTLFSEEFNSNNGSTSIEQSIVFWMHRRRRRKKMWKEKNKRPKSPFNIKYNSARLMSMPTSNWDSTQLVIILSVGFHAKKFSLNGFNCDLFQRISCAKLHCFQNQAFAKLCSQIKKKSKMTKRLLK